ncbi:MAG: hypothetical protein PHD46_03555 [Eubacteriales bacterium]|nr:hypothetical protein [Eubacteriales bacterium]MDD4422096.1 hypothetical protein [Eubacteriales bacterium]HBR30828.1 hypothetical protein [Clostridiales bacterium]
MKKIICLILFSFITLSMFSCGESKQEESKSSVEVGSVTTIVKDIQAANGLNKGKTFTSESTVAGEYLDEALISSYYGNVLDVPNFTKIEEYCVYIEDFDTNLRIEIGIFKVINSNDNTMVSDFLKLRKERILEHARNYPSVDAEPFANVIIDTIGNYTYYVAVKENRTEINKSIREKLGA